MKYSYYLRDDGLVFRANVATVEYWAIGAWRESRIHHTEVELKSNNKDRLTKISQAKARAIR